MTSEHIVTTPPSSRVCQPEHVGWFDNFLRPWIHNPRKLFGPYVQPTDTALDVGCGAGWASLQLARLVGPEGRVIAADLQPAMLDKVRARAQGAGLVDRIHLHRCGEASVGVEETVDFAVAFWMAHEVPDLGAFFREMRRIVRGGGRLLLVEPWGHVSRYAFDCELAAAKRAHLGVQTRPRVLFSRAAVLG